MIEFANKETRPFVRSMWKTVFEDRDEYIDLLFSTKYSDQNTLIYFEDGKAVASLQMLPYKMCFYREIIDMAYFAGLCTLPAYRSKGYMGKLVMRAFEIMLERSISLSVLVPAEDWLFGYYEKYGYTITFEKGKNPINLDSFLLGYPERMEHIFETFDRSFQQTDFTVLKTKDELDAVIQEYIQENCPLKYNLRGMSRVVDALPLLKLYAQSNTDKNFVIQVNDHLLNRHFNYQIQDGNVDLIETDFVNYEVDIKLLTKLLFGFHLEDVNQDIKENFREQNPVINLMLE